MVQKAKNGGCTTSHPSILCLAIPIAYPVLSLHNATSSPNNLFFFDYPEYEGRNILINVGKQLPPNTASYPIKMWILSASL